jgi:hypothetical protein
MVDLPLYFPGPLLAFMLIAGSLRAWPFQAHPDLP